MRKTLQEVKAIVYRELRLWLRYPTWIFTFLAFPYVISGLFYLIGLAIGGKSAITNFQVRTGSENVMLYNLIGSGVLLIAILVVEDVGQTIRREQLLGTLEAVFVTPAKRTVLLYAAPIPHVLIASLMFLGSVSPAVFVTTKVNPLDMVLALFFLLIGLIPLVGLGFIVASLVVKFKEPWPLVGVLNSLISSVSGVAYPLTLLPKWLRIVSYAFPTSHAITLIREALIYHSSLANYWLNLSILSFMFALYPLAGYLLYKRFEREAMKSGGFATH